VGRALGSLIGRRCLRCLALAAHGHTGDPGGRAVRDRSIEFGRAPALATCLTPGRSGSLFAACATSPLGHLRPLGSLGRPTGQGGDFIALMSASRMACCIGSAWASQPRPMPRPRPPHHRTLGARRPTFFGLIIALDGVTQGRTQSITQILADAAIVILASAASVGQ
jgi:hypothetical protein